MGVDTTTILNWEKGRASPELRYMPAIIAFLGYDPRPKPASLSEQLIWFREGKGWTQAQLARALRVDPSTLARWESGKKAHWGEYVGRIEVLLGK